MHVFWWAFFASRVLAVEPIPDGVADGRVAYTTDEQGDVAAIDLASGTPRWTFAGGGRVLAVDAAHVAVWQAHAGTYHVAFLDPATGALQRTSDDLAIAYGGFGADVRARWDGGRLVVDWLTAYFSPSHQGERMTPPIHNGTRFVGQIVIDPATGAATVPATPSEPKPPEIDPALRAGPLYTTATTGAQILTETLMDGRTQATLARFDLAGNALPGVTLGAGRDLVTRFVGDEVSVRAGAALDLYAIDSGAHLARLPVADAGVSAVVSGDVVLVLEQQAHTTATPDPGRARALAAFDAASGTLRWRRAIAPEDLPALPP